MSDTGSQEKDPLTGTEQPFVQHLKELRDRLVKSFIEQYLISFEIEVDKKISAVAESVGEFIQTKKDKICCI